jgi:hypothetical protein
MLESNPHVVLNSGIEPEFNMVKGVVEDNNVKLMQFEMVLSVRLRDYK